MDFFRSQDDARRRTRLLAGLFVLSVVTIILLLYTLFGFLTHWKGGIWNPQILGGTAVATLAVVFAGSGYKTIQLAAHGGEIARSLGGRQIDPDTTQPDERRLLNVVEEMALASGVPVPEVWVLDEEDGINAFASGHSPADAAIGVTRGCLRTLTRSELQGVIAHEFSHILNGDMRLNLRLIGIVHGILIIALAGRFILRSSANVRTSGRDKGAGGIVFVGLGLLAIGSLGVFFSKLIKSAISRQREFLADASAVQFTRHPEGIGSALLKIGGSEFGSRLETARAEEASHMMFGNALKGGRIRWFATHPPLEERIRAILPHWDGRWPEVRLPDIASRRDSVRRPPPASIVSAAVGLANASTAIERIGNVTGEELAVAADLHASIPAPLRELLYDPGGAQAVVFAAILFAESGVGEEELRALDRLVDSATRDLTVQIAEQIRSWHSSHLIALIDLAIPALRRLTPAEYARFSAIITDLIHSDREVDLFEFMLQKIVRRHLDQYFRRTPPGRIRYHSWTTVASAAGILLTAMATLGSRDSAARAAALEAGRKYLESEGVTLQTPPSEPGLPQINIALDRFDEAAPPLKRILLHACSVVAMHDGTLSSDEAELLRATADTIGCPLPPFVPATPGPPAAT